jgi:hypothetical protein
MRASAKGPGRSAIKCPGCWYARHNLRIRRPGVRVPNERAISFQVSDVWKSSRSGLACRIRRKGTGSDGSVALGKRYCDTCQMRRDVTFSLIIAAALLAFAAINLWAISRLVASNNTQAATLRTVVRTNEMDTALRKFQLNVEQLQLRIAEEQLQAIRAQSDTPNRKQRNTPEASPSSSPQQIAPAPVYISTGDNSTWPANYGALLAGAGAVIAGLAALRTRKTQPSEGDRPRQAPDDGVHQLPSEADRLQRPTDVGGSQPPSVEP